MCNDGEVRLCDGENFNQREGRVETCFNGVWGAVCADGWNEIATNILCTQLGYENGKYKDLLGIANSNNYYYYRFTTQIQSEYSNSITQCH